MKKPGPMTPWAIAAVLFPLLLGITRMGGVTELPDTPGPTMQEHVLNEKLALLHRQGHESVQGQTLVLGDSRMRSLFLGEDRLVRYTAPSELGGRRYLVLTAPAMGAQSYLAHLERLMSLEPAVLLLEATLFAPPAFEAKHHIPGVQLSAQQAVSAVWSGAHLESAPDLDAGRALLETARARGVTTVVLDLPVSRAVFEAAPRGYFERRRRRLATVCRETGARLIVPRDTVLSNHIFDDLRHFSHEHRAATLRLITARLDAELELIRRRGR
jgi:hypothetical protein